MADNEQDGTLRKRKRKRQGKTMPTNSDVQDESPPPKKSYQSLVSMILLVLSIIRNTDNDNHYES